MSGLLVVIKSKYSSRVEVESSEMPVLFEEKLQNPAIETCNTKEIDEHISNFYQNERSLKEVDYKKMLPIIEYILENDSITTKKVEGKTDNSQYMVIK